MTLAQLLVAAVLMQRLAELWLARRNAERLLDRGGVEHGAEHYPHIVIVHAAWLAAIVLFLPEGAPVDPWLLGVFLALQAARIWVIATLGERWTTRVIVLPAAPLVRSGPYRFLRHPNYVVVAGEIAVFPLIFGLWPIAVVFSLLNAIVLYQRIKIENRALAGAAS